MADDSMALLETLRKATAAGDVDVLREGVRLLSQGDHGGGGQRVRSSATERVQRRIHDSCWRPSFARSLVPRLGGLVRDLEAYLRSCNEERVHTGRQTRGRTPLDTQIRSPQDGPR